MASTCAVCGKNIGGLFGLASADEAELQNYRNRGYDIPAPICHACSLPYKQTTSTELNLQERAQGAPVYIPDIPIYTFNPFPQPDYINLGMVTAHVALGTGMITSIVSSFNDLFGQESNIYDKKMSQATQACLDKLKINAAETGADCVIGVHVTHTELTAGHGMIMVCMAGTAIKKA